MFKIRKIKFKNHPVLKNLELNFCDSNGKAMDTIIIAGENGTGKSTILNELYEIFSYNAKNEIEYELEENEKIYHFTYFFEYNPIFKKNILEHKYYFNDNKNEIVTLSSLELKEMFSFSSILSNVDINFDSNNIQSVTSLNLDENPNSYKSSSKLPTEINQLLIDVQALDDADIAMMVRKHPNLPYSETKIDERMNRFKNAFNNMFETLTYSHIENVSSHKSIIFEKFGQPVEIENLSSGEKQVIYRGCFLLKNIKAMKGSFVLIDEPEISLHPTWQNKIMDFYKNIFKDENGVQTSQIFAVTHSPFIVHNDKRYNDKIIVLVRNETGEIITKDKPDYYKCNSIEAVQDAFSVSFFNQGESTVYLEGRTDEKYFNKALEIFNINPPFKFKWIGYLDEHGQEAFTGYTNLDKAYQFLIARNLSYKNVCLYDCDTKKEEKNFNNVYIKCIPQYDNKTIKKGIENALKLDNMDLSPFYSKRETVGNYGEAKIIEEFEKMAFCDYICNLEKEKLEIVMKNIRDIVNDLLETFDIKDGIEGEKNE